jgi:hypothetical protein
VAPYDYRRFGAPVRAIPAPRDKVTGLGSTDSEQVPADEPGGPVEEPHAFTGIRSRSRFIAEPKPPAIGHGGPTSGLHPLPTLPEPNLESQFDSQAPLIQVPVPYQLPQRAERMASLGQSTPFLERIMALVFVRSRREGGENPPGPAMGGPGGGIERAADLIRWSDFGVVPGKVNRRYTLRKEFLQDAQAFLGLRRYEAKRGATSTSPVRMLPPRISRLTDRRLPGSFGQTTEVLTEG